MLDGWVFAKNKSRCLLFLKCKILHLFVFCLVVWTSMLL